MKNNIIKSIILFIIFGFIYCGIEIIWRGYTHPSMFIVGGLCCLLIGLINEITPDMPMWLQCLLSMVIIVVIEFISGCILNLGLGLHVWDYSNMPFNILGQVCLPFSIIWFFLSYIAIKLDDYFRRLLFHEE